jgi:hypothetical protein
MARSVWLVPQADTPTASTSIEAKVIVFVACISTSSFQFPSIACP